MPSASSVTGTTATADTGTPAYRGRFAPSPTGRLHLGSLVAALGSYLDARAAGGRWQLRMEDIDPPREEPGAADAIRRSLEAHALHWDGPLLRQSEAAARHRAARETLERRGPGYYCDCSRRRQRRLAAEHGLAGGVYPGHCRDRGLGEGALRVRVGNEPVCVDDRSLGTLCQALESDVGDFVVWRRDGLVAYQLAVVVDDAAEGINRIVRGADLWDNTPRQVWLQQRLGLPRPEYLHLPMVVGGDGDKLSKQTGAAAVAAESAAQNVHTALNLLQQKPPGDYHPARPDQLLSWAVEHWKPQAFHGLKTVSADSVAAQQNPLR